MAPRVLALSDVHADLAENMAWLRALSTTDYRDATLLLAGDVSDDLAVLGRALRLFRDRFARVFFVPGNHELWVRRREAPDSLAKLGLVERLCRDEGVETEAGRVGSGAGEPGVWIVPLPSWYVQPEEGEDTLFLPKPGEDPTLSMWSDRYFTAWPRLPEGVTLAEHLLDTRCALTAPPGDAPVISFSHFLPRRDLILATPEERAALGPPAPDPHPRFNFSRVAGWAGLERRLRRLGAVVHVYGHQHRNRRRLIDGVRYVSHCLGYPRERQATLLRRGAEGPAPVWGPEVP